VQRISDLTLSSMTGFARAEGVFADWRWSWEVKSVNGRSLDIRVRMPYGHERLELAVREAASKRFKRGSLNMVLNLARESNAETDAAYQVNGELLAHLIAVAREHMPADAPVEIETLMNVRGVIEKVEEAESESDEAARHAAILKGLGEALDALAENRRTEGAKLDAILGGQLDGITGIVAAAAASESLRPEAKKAWLAGKLQELLDADPPVTEERLAQELALLATKGDVTEELDRLGAHIEAARALMAEDGAVGRRLDFLCQELNREANTVCSKSGDVDLTKHGLELKALIEQFREQVQNVE
jgi:uncharacterized protein (TIGR00255 family)